MKSKRGSWVEDSYVAWEYLEGSESNGRYEDKIALCDAFSDIFEPFSKPNFIDLRNDPWSIADRIAWGETEKRYDDEMQRLVDAVLTKLKPIDLPNQIIHGDIAGNIIFSAQQPPGVIDLTLYWRPKNFAKALLVVDALTWEHASIKIYDLIIHVPDIDQLLLRAGLRRMIENPEHVLAFGKDASAALHEAKQYLKSLESLGLLRS